MRKEDKRRMSLYVPRLVYERLDYDSKLYGITKTALVQSMIVAYYRSVDHTPDNAGTIRRVSSGKLEP